MGYTGARCRRDPHGPGTTGGTAWWALALTATLTLSAAACGGDDDPGPTADDTTTTTAKTTSTTVPPEKLPAGHFIDLHLPDDLTAEEKEVAEAYRDALEAFARAQRDPSDEPHPLATTRARPVSDADNRT